jgi:hypothetical protein
MVRIRKEKGGSGIGPYWWPEDDPVAEVPELLAADLLAIPEWGYSREPAPEDPGEADSGTEDGPGRPPARKRAARA